jgi:hypothetical protein
LFRRFVRENENTETIAEEIPKQNLA